MWWKLGEGRAGSRTGADSVGCAFDKEKDGDYKLGKEGGHSNSGIIHHKDVTGWEMERALLAAVDRQPNIEKRQALFCY